MNIEEECSHNATWIKNAHSIKTEHIVSSAKNGGFIIYATVAIEHVQYLIWLSIHLQTGQFHSELSLTNAKREGELGKVGMFSESLIITVTVHTMMTFIIWLYTGWGNTFENLNNAHGWLTQLMGHQCSTNY